MAYGDNWSIFQYCGYQAGQYGRTHRGKEIIDLIKYKSRLAQSSLEMITLCFPEWSISDIFRWLRQASFTQRNAISLCTHLVKEQFDCAICVSPHSVILTLNVSNIENYFRLNV